MAYLEAKFQLNLDADELEVLRKITGNMAAEIGKRLDLYNDDMRIVSEIYKALEPGDNDA